MADTWAALPHFTTYFGTALHGAEITWYNDPSASGANIANKNNLKVEIVQNLHSFLYTWWDKTNTDDLAWFAGQYAFEVVDPILNKSNGSGGFLTNIWIGKEASADATQDRAAPTDLVFGLWFDNPVASALPKKDGVYTTAKYEVDYTAGSNVTPVGKVLWNPDVFWDIKNADNTSYDITTFDSAFQDNAVNVCVVSDGAGGT